MKKWMKLTLFLIMLMMFATGAGQKPGETETTETETETEAEQEVMIQRKRIVAIDPGHQGSWVDMSEKEAMAPGSDVMKAKATTGTEGQYSGVPEYELNLRIGLALKDELLSRGYEVIMTREDNDTAISNQERAILANENGADISVRIHANGSTDRSVSGALTMAPSGKNPYVGDLSEASVLLAECIIDTYCEATGLPNQGVLLSDDMTGINFSAIPVTIVEMGYMSNEHDDLYMTSEENEQEMVTGIADGIDQYFEKTEPKKIDFTGLLEKISEEYLQELTKDGEKWSITAIDLFSDSILSVNDAEVLQSASVIKVFIMGAVYERAVFAKECGKERIDMKEAYDGELKDLLTAMITVSDNEASNELVKRLGGGDFQKGAQIVNEFCKEHGFTETHLGRRFLETNPTDDNYTSAKDCAVFLYELYQGTLVTKEASAKMMELIGGQQRTWKIPAGVPETVETANKTGEMSAGYGLGSIENDIAIVLNGKYPYILCVLSNDIHDNGTAQNVIVGISELVYEFLATMER